jgi:hypothetical protein
MRMNKKGDVGDGPLMNNVIFAILFLLFLIPMLIFVASVRDNVAKWEDFYAKEVVRIVDIAEPGTEVYLDVDHVIKIGKKHGREKDFFEFSNVDDDLRVSFREKGGSSFDYFNDVDILGNDIKFSGHHGVQRLYYKIVEVRRKWLGII